MTGGRLTEVVRRLRRALAPPGDDDTADARLLQRFASCRDEEAFAELVRRHGPLVLGVCRRVLRHEHDAEDAFQATFLVLARKARSIARPGLLANWLYGVALRVAAKARAAAARRRERERQVDAMPTSEPDPGGAGHELRAVLDEEVGRLPEKYRAPVVLCYLEGRTNEEAARLLGWPLGTVFGRLARARDLLRTRLARRGLAVTAAAAAAALAESAAPAAVPGNLIDTTIKAAVLVAVGKAAADVASPSVAALTEGVLRAMFLSKLRIAGVILVCLVLLGAGVGVLARQGQEGAPPAGGQAAAPAPDDKKKEEPPADKAKADDEIKALLKARADTAETVVNARYQEFVAGRGTLDILLRYSEKRLEAELEQTDKKEEQLAALKKHLELMQEIEKINQARFDAGRVSIADLAASQLARIEAELRLARAKAK
jgi:RNA polymerase sigma factor (sigma-70 family)